MFSTRRPFSKTSSNTITSTLLVLLGLLVLYTPSMDASSLVAKVQRYENGSNTFYFNTLSCNKMLCEDRNAYSVQVAVADDGMCACECKGQSVYSFSDDKCLNAGKESGSFVIGDTTKTIKVFTHSELRAGGLSIKFCPDTDCVGNLVSNCKIDSQRSYYDDVSGWQPLFTLSDRVDFIIDANNYFKLDSNTTRYNGILLKIWISCSVKMGEPLVLIPSFATFAVEGIFSTPVSETETKPPLATVTTTPTATTPASTTIKATTELPITVKLSTTVAATTTPATTTPITATSVPTTTTKKTNETEDILSGQGNPTTSANQSPQQQQKQESDESSNMTLIIVTVLLGVFLIVSCILLACFYQRWRRAKKRTAEQTSDPPFFFQPQTPVFLIGRDGKQRRPLPPAAMSHFTNDLNESQRTTASDTELYNPGKPVADKQRYTSIRHLYASIDKFLKFGGNNKTKSNSSLDEGYTTDDNYDYRRFAAFPKDLYDEPGSIVSSVSEPDYKIPEDFINSQMSVTETRMEDDHLRPAGPSMEASILRVLRDQQLDIVIEPTMERGSVAASLESPYSLVGDALPRRERAITNPYDEVGEPLANKVNDLKNCKGEEPDYDIPENDTGSAFIISNGQLRNIESPPPRGSSLSSLSRVIENSNTLDIEYEGAVAV